ncbi:AAA family ATPase, partial [Aeromonas hydrophila]|uniref:AAA family ATPase n=1 Tax=Aeromonas hydrophila TaxID=644 RepID=UPI003D1C6C4F
MRLSVISLKNFKSFESVRIELSNLNVLSGSNSAGKSSIIQALLLLKQNNENIRFSFVSEGMKDSKAKIPRFDINGPLVKLGQDGGLLYIDASDDEIVLSVSDTLGQVNLSNCAKEGANKRGNSSRLTQSFHFFMFEPI